MENADQVASVRGELAQGGKWCIVLGIILILLGTFAIVSPFVAGIAMTLVVGWLLLGDGVVRAVFALKAPSFGSGALRLLGGALSILGAVLMWTRPMMGLALLTMLLGIYFLIDGLTRSFLALGMRPLAGWGWTLFNGVLGILLGIAVIARWPVSGLWVIGVFVGIHILLRGWSLLALGLAARGAARSGASD
jgi:uncharacterized membrane protein HdeD (DUF308 family)